MITMSEFERTLVSLRGMFVDYPARYRMNYEEIILLQREEQDLLHMAEFVNLNLYESYKFYKGIQELRQKRRILKDENQLLEPILKLSRQENNTDKKLIDETLGEVRKLNRNQGVRSYRMKVRKDLQDIIDKRRSKRTIKK